MFSVRQTLARPPWLFLAGSAAALLVQLHPGWRDALVYDRGALRSHEFWRLWTGHWVHFGWPHFVADAGLFFILGWLMERSHPWFSRTALLLMPPFISAALYWCDPTMERYAGLSAVNLGLLLYFAGQGWQRDWRDWFWPAVLAIYIGEIVFEAQRGGRGGGMIQFDDPGVKVATGAHIASAVYALLGLGANFLWHRAKKRRAGAKGET